VGEGAQHAEFHQSHFRRGHGHGAAVIGMENQLLLSACVDPLPQAGAADHIRRLFAVLTVLDLPGDELAALDVHHQVDEEVKPHAADAGEQVGDVPASELIETVRMPPGHRPRLLQRPAPSAALHLLVGMEHAVEAALGL